VCIVGESYVATAVEREEMCMAAGRRGVLAEAKAAIDRLIAKANDRIQSVPFRALG
jgi:hypothetical protein